MTRLRAICRALIDSPLLGVALGVCAAVALGSAVAPARAATTEKATVSWSAIPALPSQLLLDADREVKAAPDSFGSQVPAMASRPAFHGLRGFQQSCGREAVHSVCLTDFGPLYRRPPPIFS